MSAGVFLVAACTQKPPADASEETSVTEPESATAWTHSSPHEVRTIRTAPGVDLEVLDWGGNGLPLVLVHGLNMNAHTFDDFAPRFTDEHRVVAITRRGHGASSWPDHGYEAVRLARDLEAVLDSLGLSDPVILAGHSAGAIEITRIAVDHPERVAGLIYIDAAYENRQMGQRLSTCPQDPSLMDAFNALMPELYHRTQTDSTGASLASPDVFGLMSPAVSQPFDYGSVDAPSLAVYNVPERVEGIFLYAAEFSSACRTGMQRHIYEGIAQFAAEMQHGTVVTLQDTQHNVHLVSPDELEAIIREWLRSEGMTSVDAG